MRLASVTSNQSTAYAIAADPIVDQAHTLIWSLTAGDWTALTTAARVRGERRPRGPNALLLTRFKAAPFIEPALDRLVVACWPSKPSHRPGRAPRR